MSLHYFAFPTPVHFGPGARSMLPGLLAGHGARRPLVVTDRGVAALPFFREILDGLPGLHVSAFSGVAGNPTESQLLDGVAAYREHGADSVVGVGGGAALDVAKAIALLAAHPGGIFDYEDGKAGALPIDRDVPPWIAVPTAPGTGSEVGRSTVISDDRTRVKRIVFSPRLLARAVVADPELTVGLPPKVTAATGMDALTHCVESFLAKGYHPICDGIALEGLRLSAAALPRAVEDGKDLAARSDVMVASMMGAIAFQKGLGVTHSCAHALSAVADLHHGLANGVMIDSALAHNAPAVPDRFARLAAAVGISGADPEVFLRWLREFKARIGIPARLSDVGVRGETIGRLADLAVRDSCHLNNPRPCAHADFERIFAGAM